MLARSSNCGRARCVHSAGAHAQFPSVPTCFVLVGLPARGKTYISKRLSRYLNWIGVTTKVFNVGEYRRKNFGTTQCKHDFFDSNNKDGQEARDQCADEALADLIAYLLSGGHVGIFDATNTTRARRNKIHAQLKSQSIKALFIESVCADDDVIRRNIIEVKLSSPDYIDVPENEALADFLARIKHYQDIYETLDMEHDKDVSYIQIINAGTKFFINMIEGHLQSRAVYFLMNIHLVPRSIYLTRHGESCYNLEQRIGGDTNLSPRGVMYAQQLAKFLKDQVIEDLRIWTSQLKRTIQTAHLISCPKEQWKALDEIDAGVCDGMTYEDIAQKYPDDFRRRDEDKYHYRYPHGESYEDLVHRLEPVIMELERQRNILVVCHQAVMRCLLAYFLDSPAHELPYIRVPLHTIIKLTPTAYGCRVETFPIPVEAVDTHRPKPVATTPG